MSDEPLYIENCKHAGEDVLIVQRNYGIRWVTCTDCGADFVRSEFYDDAESRIAQLRARVARLEGRDPLEVFMKGGA